MIKAVPFFPVHGAEEGNDYRPGKGQFRIEFVLKFNGNAVDRDKIIYVLAALHHHCFRYSGISFGKPLPDLGVSLTGAEPLGNLLLILRGKQSAVPGQHILQIAVGAVWVGGKIVRDCVVSAVLIERCFKTRYALGTKDWIGQCGV